MIPDIAALAELWVGEALEEEERQALSGFCSEALSSWTLRLKGGVTPEDCTTALIPACAMSALAGFLTGREGAAAPLSFTAGDISIRQEGGATALRMQSLREQAKRLMAPYINDEDFHVQGVRG